MASMTRTSKVARWGNSLAVRIPQEAAEQLGVVEGSEVQLVVRDRAVTIRPVRGVYTLDQLLEGVTPDKAGGEVDSGPPVGREVW